VEVGEERVILANLGGHLYAVNDVCTHADGSLSDGLLEGEEVECPLHGSRFNVISGDVLQGPAQVPIQCYTVRVEGADILIGPA
jgi:nitrite reductase/ring-hydroxylating ferredoxin subunit